MTIDVGFIWLSYVSKTVTVTRVFVQPQRRIPHRAVVWTCDEQVLAQLPPQCTAWIHAQCFRPRFVIFTWYAVEFYLWPGTLDYALWVVTGVLALKALTGFVKIRRRI
jgi:hypothetical protein